MKSFKPKEIAEAFWARKPQKKPDSPGHEQLLENQAARLKTLIAEASRSCLAELRNKLNAS